MATEARPQSADQSYWAGIKLGWQGVNRTFSRRKVTLFVALSTCLFVFLVNLTLALVAQTRLESNSPDSYIRTLYSGDCNDVKQISTSAHFVVNVLSTLMLWASNLAMQLTAAPTRAAVNKAHAKGEWLDIGILSFRNLKAVPRAHLVVWMLLASSSFPIHFLYNSVIFNALHTNQYFIYVVTESIFDGPLTNTSILGRTPEFSEFYDTTGGQVCNSTLATRTNQMERLSRHLDDFHARRHAYKNVSTLECLEAYNNPFKYRPNVFLITNQTEALFSNLCMPSLAVPGANWTLLDMVPRRPTDGSNFYSATLCEYAAQDVFQRDCGRVSSGRLSEEEATNVRLRTWPKQFHFQRCIYDESVTPQFEAQHKCYLQCSPVLLFIVTLFNGVKCVCIVWMIWRCDRRTLSTIGDAIASFLENPDIHTADFGVSTRKAIISLKKANVELKGANMTLKTKAERWWHAAETGPWVVSLVFFPVVMIAASFFITDEVLVQKKYSRDSSMQGLWKLGFGEAKSEAIISWNQKQDGVSGLLVNLGIANVWQFLVSLLYMSFTVILTSQLVAREWASYASTRKPLRVSKPEHKQRATYFVSMPYRYGVPIIIIFAVEHWLLSQSSFVIRLLRFGYDGEALPGTTTAGFSIIPSFLGLLLAFLIFTGYILNGVFRRYPKDPWMPLACTNSLAISANCHPPHDDKIAHHGPVSWGAYDCSSQRLRCGFTSRENCVALEDDMTGFGLDERSRNPTRRWATIVTDWWNKLPPYA